ncbi:MAG: hypothetical protein ABII10_00990 [Candidatus Paceibacterota bacterium]
MISLEKPIQPQIKTSVEPSTKTPTNPEKTPPELKILLADNVQIVREALSGALKRQPGVRGVDSVGTVDSVLQILRQQGHGYNYVIICGFEGDCRKILEEAKKQGIPATVLTSHEDLKSIAEKFGAQFLLKGGSTIEQIAKPPQI